MVSQIKIGFLRGIGFSIAFILAWAIFYAVMFSVFEGWISNSEEEGYVEFGGETELIPKVLSYEVNEDRATLLGVIENESDYSWERTSVEVEFYQDDIFVRECSEEIQATIKSGNQENFELSCKSCGDKFPEFDRIEIKIIDSWKTD